MNNFNFPLKKLIIKEKGMLEDIRFELPSGSKEEYLEYLNDLQDDIKQYLKESTRENRKSLILSFFKAAFWNDIRDNSKLHPSEISYNFCPRLAFFKLLSIPFDKGFIQVVSTDLQKIFDFGTLVHLYIQYNLLRANFIQDFETPVKVPEYNLTGSADGVGEDFVLEIKTINPYSFNSLKAPTEAHLKQASIYAHFLNKKYILFLYIDKSSLKIKEFKVVYDKKYIKTLLNNLDALRMLKKQVYGLKKVISAKEIDYDSLPERICRSRLSEIAMNCPFANKCFNK